MPEPTVASAPSAGATASPAPTPTSSTPSSGSPADVYFAMAQAATAEPPAPTETPAEAKPPADVAPTETAPQEAAAAPDPNAPPAPLTPADEAAMEDVSYQNLPDDVKEIFRTQPWLRTRFFQAEGMRELGHTLGSLRNLAKAGFTAQTLNEIQGIFPGGVEDARRTAQLAASMQQLNYDFQNDPESFVRNLSQADPEAAKRIAQTIAGQLPAIDRESYVNTLSQGFWTALQRVEEEALQGSDEQVQLAVQILRDKMFPGSQAAAQQQPQLPQHVQAELQSLREQQNSIRQQQVQAYQGEIYQRSVNGLGRVIDQLVREANPNGMSEAGLARVREDAMRAIGNDFLSNPIVRGDLDRMMRAGAPADQVMQFVGARLQALAPRRVSEVLRFYTQEMLAARQAPAARPAPSAPPRDIGSVGGAPRPVAAKPEFKPVAGRDYAEQMQEYLAGGGA